MPSGAKKRKAAKKKKENQSNNAENQPPNPHGDEEDSKHQSQEDKDSDVGEVEEIETKESKIESFEGHKKPTEEESSIRVEREFSIEEESSPKNGSSKNSDGSSRSSSSNSSSSSDDESHDEAKISGQSAAEASDSLSEKPIEETGDSVFAKSPVIGSEKIPSLSERAEVVSLEGDSSSLNPRSVESVIEEDIQEKQLSVEDKADRSTASSEIARSVEKTDKVLDPNEYIAQESDKNLAVSDIATKPTSDIGVVSEPDSGFTMPYIANPPRPVQTTSWKGCCGLFELFAGSGR